MDVKPISNYANPFRMLFKFTNFPGSLNSKFCGNLGPK